MNEHQQISLKTYTTIDISIFAVLLCLFEFLSLKLLKIDILPDLYVSITLPILLITLVRWNYKMAILPALAGLVFGLSSGAHYQTYLTYGIGNMFIMLNLLWFIKGKDKVQNETLHTILFILTGYLLMCFGKGLVSSFFEGNFVSNVYQFLRIDLINLFLCFFIIFIAKRQKGIFQDQIQYLKNIQKEKYESNYDSDTFGSKE